MAFADRRRSAEQSCRNSGLTCDLVAGRNGNEGPSQRQTRDLSCTFRPGSLGPEETYTGTLQYLVGERQPESTRVLIWIVKALPTTAATPGLLQQIYAADPGAPTGHAPALIGESNGSIILQPMADSPASNEPRAMTGTLIVLVTLTLTSTSG
jgi:hypothetical protein